MNHFKLIVTLLASAPILSAAPFNTDSQLVTPYTDRLRGIIQSEDNPHKLAEVWQEQLQALGHQCPDPDLLTDLIQLNRVESFKFYLNHMYSLNNCDHVFRSMKYNNYKQFSFLRAFHQRRIEICDYLLREEPDIEAPNISDFLFVGLRPVTNDDRSAVELLKKLATLRPERIPEMAPRFYWIDDVIDAESTLLILDFIDHCRSTSPDFAAEPQFQPNDLLGRLLLGKKIRDDALATVIPRLMAMGASFSKELLETYKSSMRYFIFPRTYQVIDEILNPSIKEPDTP